MSEKGKSIAMAYALKRAKSSGIPLKRPERAMHTAKSIVDAIRSKKKTFPIEEESEPLEDEEFLEDDLDLEEDEPEAVEEQSPQDKRQQMLYKIMSRDR